MLETAPPLCIVLMGPGKAEINSFNFCINRRLNDIAYAIWYLREVEGIDEMVRAISDADDSLDDLTVVELVFEDCDDMPAVFGRLGFTLAHELGVSYEDTYLMRPIECDNSEITELSSMTLPSYVQRFPTTLAMSRTPVQPEWAVVLELEQSLRSA